MRPHATLSGKKRDERVWTFWTFEPCEQISCGHFSWDNYQLQSVAPFEFRWQPSRRPYQVEDHSNQFQNPHTQVLFSDNPLNCWACGGSRVHILRSLHTQSASWGIYCVGTFTIQGSKSTTRFRWNLCHAEPPASPEQVWEMCIVLAVKFFDPDVTQVVLGPRIDSDAQRSWNTMSCFYYQIDGGFAHLTYIRSERPSRNQYVELCHIPWTTFHISWPSPTS